MQRQKDPRWSQCVAVESVRRDVLFTGASLGATTVMQQVTNLPTRGLGLNRQAKNIVSWATIKEQKDLRNVNPVTSHWVFTRRF